MTVQIDSWLFNRINRFYESNQCDILLIQEVGSWIWGYNAQDSDHDLLAIYAHYQSERLLFNTNKVTPGRDLVDHVFEWSQFIELALKFNFNAFAYCQVASTNTIMQDERFLIFNKWYQNTCKQYKVEILKKLLIQLVSQVNSYYKQEKTIKTFIRTCYMAQLAFVCYYQLLSGVQVDKDFILNVRLTDYEIFRKQLLDQEVLERIDPCLVIFEDLEEMHKAIAKYTTSESRKQKINGAQNIAMDRLQFFADKNIKAALENVKFDLPTFSTQTKVDLYRGDV